MLDVLWMLLFIVAVIIIIIIADLEYHDFPLFWSLMLIVLDTILWFLLAASVFEMEIPYAVYNASSNVVEQGVNMYTSKTAPEMSLFCLMMAIIMMVYGLYAFLSTVKTLYEEEKE